MAFLVLYIIRMVFFIKFVNVKVTKWLPMCTEIYRLVQRAPKQLPQSLQCKDFRKKASTQNQKSKCDKPILRKGWVILVETLP